MHSITELPKIDLDNTEVSPQIYIKYGKHMQVTFDECFEKASTILNNFIISKSAYSKNLDSICRYCNTFFKYYDKDKEFLTGLLAIKYNIDSPNEYFYPQFISDIAEYLFTDSVIEKIFAMVNDYYSIDLSPSDEVKNIDLGALQFLDEHGKALMALSIAYKLIIPVVCHYYHVYGDQMAEIAKIKGESDFTMKKYLYRTFGSLFPLFQGDSEIFNKIVATVISHLTGTRTSEKTLWNRARNKKLTPTTYTDSLAAVVVVDLIPKAVFSKNFIYLIQTAIPRQIKMQLIAKDKYEYVDISQSGPRDELSGIEKFEANKALLSDLDRIISTTIDAQIKKIKEFYDIEYTDNEIEYYKEHLTDFVFSSVIKQFFARHFGGSYDLKSISKRNYIELVIIFKKLLTSMKFVYLQHILTGNLSKSIKRRKISSKQLDKIQASQKFKKLMSQYSMGMDTDNNAVLKNLAAIINTPIEYCDYDNKAMFGNQIVVDIDLITEEYIRFLELI